MSCHGHANQVLCMIVPSPVEVHPPAWGLSVGLRTQKTTPAGLFVTLPERLLARKALFFTCPYVAEQVQLSQRPKLEQIHNTDASTWISTWREALILIPSSATLSGENSRTSPSPCATVLSTGESKRKDF